MSETLRLTDAAKADIQGFITSGYGHLPCTAYLFVEFRDPGEARRWLRELVPQVSTARSWRVRPGEAKHRPERTLNIALTHAGLRQMGLPDSALNTFPPEFRAGMASADRARILGDTGASAPEHWEFGGPEDVVHIHALLILNAATQPELSAWRDAQRSAIAHTNGGIREHVTMAQAGERPEHGKEPFGFFDGVAQPHIKGIQGDGISTGEFILGYENEYGFLPVSPIVALPEDERGLLPSPASPSLAARGYRDLGFNGSFIVYRKLHQDVAGFWRFVQAEAVRFGGQPDAEFMVWLAAKIVGRWPSGAALALAPQHDRPELSKRDDFLYAHSDPHGLACPMGAHVRRTNPRDMIRPSGSRASLHMSARHRLLRRGKPYGDPLFDLAALDALTDRDRLARAILNLVDDGKPRGIHFVCVNANIKSQFEFVQQTWADNPRFNGLTDYRPATVSEAGPPMDPKGTHFVPSSPFGLRTSAMPQFVTTRGGGYFFMPSLTALRFLATLRDAAANPPSASRSAGRE